MPQRKLYILNAPTLVHCPEGGQLGVSRAYFFLSFFIPSHLISSSTCFNLLLLSLYLPRPFPCSQPLLTPSSPSSTFPPPSPLVFPPDYHPQSAHQNIYSLTHSSYYFFAIHTTCSTKITQKNPPEGWLCWHRSKRLNYRLITL